MAKARVERLKSRGEQLRAQGVSVSATLQLYAGAVANQEQSTAPEAPKTVSPEQKGD